MPQKQTPSLHIFKPGKWTTMAGEVIEFSQADIEATAQAYDTKISKAPLVIGHPATDDPAQGWAATLLATARGLFATPAKVDPAFAESVRAGRYGTISAKFYRPTEASNPVPGVWYLRHIGFLGATNPAVKGLDDPAFADSEDGCVCFQEHVEFSEWDAIDNANMWRNLRDWFIGKFGQEEADRVIPAYQVRSLEQGAQDDFNEAKTAPSGLLAPAFSQPNQEAIVSPEEKSALEATNTRLAAELAAAQATIAATSQESRHAANVAFCDAIPANKLLPAWKDMAVAAMDHLGAAEKAVEFGEGDARAPLLDKFKQFLQALPESVSFSEHATKDKAAATAVDFADAQSISDAATAYQAEVKAKGQDITHAQAVAAVAASKSK